MDDPIDLGPSGMRLAEIGALQERVRVLEASMNYTLHPDDVKAAVDAYADTWGVSDPTSRMGIAILAYKRARRARALSELAAADAEMLVPPVMDRLDQLKRDPHLHVSPHQALEQEGAARIAQIKHDTLPQPPDCA